MTRLGILFIAIFLACSDDTVDLNLTPKCSAAWEEYGATIRAGTQCDPTAAEPCTAYDKIDCPSVGVSPTAVFGLNVAYAKYISAGCSIPLHSCPNVVETPPPYTCEPSGDGPNRCMSLCENMSGGHATCVSQDTGCTNLRLDGFCSGQSMICCLQF
jgi:hypothetical protein